MKFLVVDSIYSCSIKIHTVPQSHSCNSVEADVPEHTSSRQECAVRMPSLASMSLFWQRTNGGFLELFPMSHHISHLFSFHSPTLYFQKPFKTKTPLKQGSQGAEESRSLFSGICSVLWGFSEEEVEEAGGDHS